MNNTICNILEKYTIYKENIKHKKTKIVLLA